MTYECEGAVAPLSGVGEAADKGQRPRKSRRLRRRRGGSKARGGAEADGSGAGTARELALLLTYLHTRGGSCSDVVLPLPAVSFAAYLAVHHVPCLEPPLARPALAYHHAVCASSWRILGGFIPLAGFMLSVAEA